MTQKQRRSSRAVQARETAREKAARFRAQEDERLRIAEKAILLQEEIETFDEETERRIAKLREERDGQLVQKREQIDALVVEMLDTDVHAQQAAERLGMSVAQVRTAKRNFDKTVAALAEQSTGAVAAAEFTPAAAAPPGGKEGPALSETGVAPQTETDEAPAAYNFPPPGGPVTVPSQDGSPETAEAATLPPGATG
ncbi:hypothetical protein [Streptomyces candidus]|uniref:Uncharacterized protein n=1 Tax=Streptomyces candidus TaxID=67283 RepID=A0A7X0HKK5_9ACTN|nr:hypothetical protein [Streptomyces candidus]MBB6439390.1 hypothetical protein [Streptomyces candidus]GHH54931.1 hypothetical protein GCM10018773_58670 [Streptomyces candidus]